MSLLTIPFAIQVGIIGGHITSPPWHHAMALHNSQYAWSFMFGFGAALAILGLYSNRYKLASLGQFMIATGCGAFSTLFLLGSLEGGPDLFTLGYFPWFFWMSLAIFLGVINLKESAIW